METKLLKYFKKRYKKDKSFSDKVVTEHLVKYRPLATHKGFDVFLVLLINQLDKIYDK